MTQVILAIHLMVVIALIIVILYQKSEGGALGMGGQGGVFTGRGQANALTRATGILATAFFLTSIALTVIPAWQRRVEGGGDWTKAINQGDIKLKEIKPGEKTAPAPEAGKDTIFDQLQRAQQQRQQQTPASAPTAPTPAVGTTKPVEAPKTEAPKPEAPKPEAPKSEAPKIEAPKPEAPAAPEPKAEAPKPASPATASGTQPTPPAAAPAQPPSVKWTSPTK